MIKAKRKIALVTAIVLVLLCAFSFTYIALKQEHKCMGEDCTVCLNILVCEAVFGTIGTAVIPSLAIALIAVRYYNVKRAFCPATESVNTLVTLKTKLSY